MKAREDDRSVFQKNIRPNILVIKSADVKTTKETDELVEIFKKAETLGSLIKIPDNIIKKLPAIEKHIEEKQASGSIFEQHNDIARLLKQAYFLSKRYDCVIANPPYMGGKSMNPILKEFAKEEYPDTKADLFAMFIERGFNMAKDKIGYNAMVTMQSWMFLSSFERCRESWMQHKTITTMAHLGPRAFSTISGEVVTVTAFTFLNQHVESYKPCFLRLIEGNEEEKRLGIINKSNAFTHTLQDDFKKIPGSPIAYWASTDLRNLFSSNKNLGSFIEINEGIHTRNNSLFLRTWFETDIRKFHVKWHPLNKGLEYRKWYGNNLYIVDWEDDGKNIKNFSKATIGSSRNFFKEGITYTAITSGVNSFRYSPEKFLYDVSGPTMFPKIDCKKILLSLNTKITQLLLKIINPTMSLQIGDIKKIPLLEVNFTGKSKSLCVSIIRFAKFDWDSYETSWDFEQLPLLSEENKSEDIAGSYQNYRNRCKQMTDEMKSMEEENNRIFIEAYGLEDELTPEVPIEEITLFANPHYRYNVNLADEEREFRFKTDTVKEFLSYAVGCMMGRYSLDKPGLVYAHAENKDFDSSQYKTFPADNDGIIPTRQDELFDTEDITSRLCRFIETVWGRNYLESNLDFISELIAPKSRESSREAIRMYFVNDFYKDHCRTYKKRPIYWLFTSGKEKTFQAIVYLHRYNESTLSRMRTEYVLPLQTKINRQIESLEQDIKTADSTSAKNKIQKTITILLKQKEELIRFDEKLRHFADKKIKIDMDDGVKVNYAKFGDLLADVKSITGKD